MLVKVYRIRAIDDDYRGLMPGGKDYLDVIANNLESAWRKFIVQRFGVLKPNPASFDIHLERTEGR